MKHSAAFVRLVDNARQHIREVSTDEVRELLDKGAPFQLIDVREEAEWLRGHLPRARHLCKGILERDIEAMVPDRDAHVILYCGGGYRSALAADNLQKMGYSNVASMAGGWRDWTAAGFAVETTGGGR